MSEKKNILFIINPISGVGKKNTIPPLIEKHLPSAQFTWKIRYTEKRNHGAEIAAAEKNNYDAIIAVGGDGSVNEIGSALIDSSCALGIVPCGSGNGIARHLKIPLNLQKAVQRIALFSDIRIDTGLVNETPFIGTCGFGFDAHIAHKFDLFGKRGFLSYAKLVIREYSHYKPPIFKITKGGAAFEKKAMLCSVANSSQFGNGFTISPHSDIQDGLFEMVFLDRFNWIKTPIIAGKFFSKSIHTSNHFTTLSFAEPLQIDVEGHSEYYYHIDGEPLKGQGHFLISIQPKSLSVL